MAESHIDLNKIDSPKGPFPRYPLVMHKPDGTTATAINEADEKAKATKGWRLTHGPDDKPSLGATDKG